MKKLSGIRLFIIFCALSQQTFSQLPDTEIFLAQIKNVKGEWKFGNAENITRRPGYDNQPCFSPGDESLLYVQVQDTTQSDIIECDFSGRTIRKITSTPESEYSPTYTPDHSKISVVRVDQDSAQRFYVFPPDHPLQARFIPGSDSIGYFCWLNDSLLAMFLVGERSSLQVLNIITHVRTFITWDIGRCMKLSPDKKSMYFLSKSDSANWMISKLNIGDLSVSLLTKALEQNEDFAVLPDASLVMGSEGKLYIWNEKHFPGWTQVMDYSSAIGPFYRIVINEKASRIAFVAYAGKKP